jgi:hypothetical protein
VLPSSESQEARGVAVLFIVKETQQVRTSCPVEIGRPQCDHFPILGGPRHVGAEQLMKMHQSDDQSKRHAINQSINQSICCNGPPIRKCRDRDGEEGGDCHLGVWNAVLRCYKPEGRGFQTQ